MAILVSLVDTWKANLLFNTPRIIAGQLVDGVWYGNADVVGDASGGSVVVQLQQSRERKLDYVHQLRDWSIRVQGTITMVATVIFAAGPAIQGQGGAGLNRPNFIRTGSTVAGDAETSAGVIQDGKYQDLLLFGDPRLQAAETMMLVSFGTNTNLQNYQVSAWGFLHRYGAFFRDVLG